MTRISDTIRSEEEAARIIEEIRESIEDRSPTLAASTRMNKASSMADRDPSREMVEAAEARTDAKIANAVAELKIAVAELRGDIREFRAATASKSTIIITAVALFAAVSAVLIGLSTLGWEGFGTGLSAHDMAVQAAREALSDTHH